MRCLFLCTLLCALSLAPAAETGTVDKDAVLGLIRQGQTYLLSQAQEGGSFWAMDRFKLGITAVVLDALVTGPEALPKDDPRVAKAYELLISYQQEDGGIYDPEEGYANYTTALTMMAAATMGESEAAWVPKAQQFLFGIQNVEPNSAFHGGIGYGSRGKGAEDLNNTHYAIQALRGTGIPADHPAMQRALRFVQRTQNLSSHNPAEWAGNDGGAVYSPDSSKVSSQHTGEADRQADEAQRQSGRLRSYGTMTYNLISSYIALDVRPGDPRLDAALDWVRNHYRFDVNPGMGPGQERQGLFYYLTMMAKSFGALGYTEIELPDGQTVDWRSDLFRAIRERAVPVESPEGAVMWVNEADRWAEGVPVMITAYMVKALKNIAAGME